MDPSAPSYIERQADGALLAALLAKEYVYLLDSRQKGKSSMVARTIVKLKEAGVTTVKLDLQRIGANVNPDQWYAGLLSEIGHELGRTKELFAYWEEHQHVGPLARWIGALQEVLLATTEEPVVVFIDEIDFVRALPFPTDEFFAGIRDCYNRRSEVREFGRLTFCLVGVATPGQLIRNPQVTPFNIGKRIDITDFTIQETSGFGARLDSSDRNGAQLMERIHYWLNGHPYLTQVVCCCVAGDPSIRSRRDVDALIHRLFIAPEGRQQEPNLADVERRMLDPDVPGLPSDEKRTQVLDLYGQVLRKREVRASQENPIVATLRLAGVGLEDRQSLRIRNRLYRVVFNEKWRRQSLPDAEIRRQAGAARLALLRTAAAAGVVVLVVTAIALNTSRLADERSRALSELGRRSNELAQTSRERKSALDTLERKNADLGRLSDERQTALRALQSRTAELQRVSVERQKSLSDLKRTASDLARVSTQRRRTIQALSAESSALDRQAYNTQISNLNLALEVQDSRRVANTFDQLQGIRYRNWEYGHLQLLINPPIATGWVERLASFERGENDELRIASPEGLYDVRNGKPTLRQKMSPPKDPEVEALRKAGNYGFGLIDNVFLTRGRYRVWLCAHDNRMAICDTRTNKLLVPYRPGTGISDVNPITGDYIADGIRDKNTFELLTIEGKVLAHHSGKSPAHLSRFLGDGSIVSTFRVDAAGHCEIHRWNRTGVTICSVDLPYFVQYDVVEISPDSSLFACIYWDGAQPTNWVEIRRTKDLTLQARLPAFSQNASALKFSPDSKQIAVGRINGVVQLYKAESGELIRTNLGQRATIRDIAFSSDGQKLASLTFAGDFVIWQTSPRPAMEKLEFGGPTVTYHTISNDGKEFFAVLSDNSIVRRNLETGQEIRRSFEGYKSLSKPGGGLALSRYWDYALALERNGCVLALDRETFRDVQEIRVFPSGDISCVTTYVPNKVLCRRWITSAADSSALYSQECAVLDLRTKKVTARFRGDFYTWAIARSGKTIASVGAEGRTIRLISLENGKVLKQWRFEYGAVGVALTYDGTEMAVGVRSAKKDYDISGSPIALFDTATGKKKGELKADRGPFGRLVYSPDGRFLTAMNSMSETSLFNIEERKLVAELGRGVRIVTVAWSPDSERIAAIVIPSNATIWQKHINELHLWDGRTGVDLLSLKFELDSRLPDFDWRKETSATPNFSADGTRIVSVGWDGVDRMWNTLPWKSAKSTPRLSSRDKPAHETPAGR